MPEDRDTGGMNLSKEQIERLQTTKGGFRRKDLEALGVPWPPPKGWKKRLLKGRKIRAKKKPQPQRIVKRTGEQNFYRSKEWADLRYATLAKNDGRCELCGRSKHDGTVLHVDHIKSVRDFPHLKADPANLQVLCATCNWGKGNRNDEDWREPRLAVLMGEAIE